MGQYLVGSVYSLQLKLFLNLNVLAHLVVPAGWGSWAIFLPIAE